MNAHQKSTMEQMAKASEMMRGVCIGKTKAPMDLVDGLGRGEFAENKDLKCYANCVLEMMQAVSREILDQLRTFSVKHLFLNGNSNAFLWDSVHKLHSFRTIDNF